MLMEALLPAMETSCLKQAFIMTARSWTAVHPISLCGTFLNCTDLCSCHGRSNCAQSGFRYTAVAAQPLDQDGNGNYGPRDFEFGRNAFTAPVFVNMDLRIAKTWTFKDRFQLQGMFEFFNLFNNANPAAIQSQQSQADTFGNVSQFLPGREGQIGLRLIF